VKLSYEDKIGTACMPVRKNNDTCAENERSVYLLKENVNKM
jgi:hypothetical protein